jgi:hypothetical protein
LLYCVPFHGYFRDNSLINKFVPHDQRPVPFSNMLFIGDGETDISSMRLVKDYGGHSVAVYNPNTTERTAVSHLIKEGRVNVGMAADYQKGSELAHYVCSIIDGLARK